MLAFIYQTILQEKNKTELFLIYINANKVIQVTSAGPRH